MYLFTDNENDSKSAVPRDSNYFMRQNRGKNIVVAVEGDNKPATALTVNE